METRGDGGSLGAVREARRRLAEAGGLDYDAPLGPQLVGYMRAHGWREVAWPGGESRWVHENDPMQIRVTYERAVAEQVSRNLGRVA